MSAQVSAENEQYLEHVVAVGMFQNQSQALNTAVELLNRREQLIRDVNRGVDQLDRGEDKPLDVDAIMSAIDPNIAD